MTFSDKAVAARAAALAAATPGDWLSLVLDHHLQIESAFVWVRAAANAGQRRLAQKWLGSLVIAHGHAEESVLYPALARRGRSHKTWHMELAALEMLDPLTRTHSDRLEQFQASLLHHFCEEEGIWFPELHRKQTALEQADLSRRYREEFERRLGHDRAA
jgi:hypothetical protein